MARHSRAHRWSVVAAVCAVACLAAPIGAQQDTRDPIIGSAGTVTAEPAISHPPTKPCVVHLFTDLAFEYPSGQAFQYAPPGNCPGPWAKVIFAVEFNAAPSAARGLAADVSIGRANIYYGALPVAPDSANPARRVERDLTDYSALLKTAQSGEAEITGAAGPVNAGAIYGSGEIEFYRADISNPAPRTPEAVLPLAEEGGGIVALAATAGALSQTFALPRNIERAYLDVFAQGQPDDEPWFTCLPSDRTGEVGICAGIAFREAEIAIDGQPAGVAPVYPWLSAGAMDPFLWSPIPGVQALNHVPYRVDLTPFAAKLSNGQRHQIAVSVYKASSDFLAAASLLLYLDRGSQQVTGELTANTIGAPPAPSVHGYKAVKGGVTSGGENVTSSRQFTIAGYVNTSHGKIETRIDEKLGFSNEQQFTISASESKRTIAQSTTVQATTTARNGSLIVKTNTHASYPLRIEISEPANSDGSSSRTTAIQQGYDSDEMDSVNGIPIFAGTLSNSIAPSDTLVFDASGKFARDDNQKSSQQYGYSNSLGACYSRTLNAANGVLIDVSDGKNCARTGR